ncbi:MAG TPA: nitroreductase family protein [Fimbriimonadaceae bacterium]|nr:nitroreductase family protein [Fimbriimonadaceae bacterium]
MPEVADVLNRHRSIRKYKPDPIDPDLVRQVCAEAIAGASSSGNLNCVTMILTRDEERKRRLYELHFEQPFILEAPLLITFCGDWFRTREWLRARGARDNFNNLVGYHVTLVDTTIVAQNVCLGFEARGLGICYMGTTLFSMRKIADLLELPDTCVPVTTIVVGYPDEDPPKRDRLPASAMIHEETYHRPSRDEIDAIFRDREVKGWERYMSHPELKAMAEERGITSLAQFYTSEVKYDPDDFAVFSREIREFMEERHFLP